MERRYFLTRHSIKPKGEDVESKRYRGISKKGVELAKESVKNILYNLEKSPKNAIIFLSGVSDEVRTRSTAEVYGDELKKKLAGKEDYIILTREDIPLGKGYSAIAKQIKEVINANPNKRIIVDIPLFLKEFSLKRKGWLTKEGKPTLYTSKLLEKHNMDEYKITREWIKHQGEFEGVKGINPINIARSYEKGISRLEKFARKYIGNRPYITGIVGHNPELDAYLTYLIGGGKVDLQTFDRVSSGKGIIKETELASIKIGPEITTLTYRGKEYQRKKNLENIIGAIVIGSLLLSLFSFLGITGNVIGSGGKNNPFGLIFIIIVLISSGLWIWLWRIR